MNILALEPQLSPLHRPGLPKILGSLAELPNLLETLSLQQTCLLEPKSSLPFSTSLCTRELETSTIKITIMTLVWSWVSTGLSQSLSELLVCPSFIRHIITEPAWGQAPFWGLGHCSDLRRQADLLYFPQWLFCSVATVFKWNSRKLSLALQGEKTLSLHRFLERISACAVSTSSFFNHSSSHCYSLPFLSHHWNFSG